MTEHVLGDVGIIAELHLLEDTASVGAHGFDAELELVADLGERFS